MTWAHSWPRQFSRVEVASYQAPESSGTSVHSALSPLAVTLAKRAMACRCIDLGARVELAAGQRAVEMMRADVVGAPLQQGDGRRHAECVAHRRQVAVEQLVLQGLGAGGDDHLAAGQQRGREVGEGLAGAGAGFGDQQAVGCDGRLHFARHGDLLFAQAVAGNGLRERAVGGEKSV